MARERQVPREPMARVRPPTAVATALATFAVLLCALGVVAAQLDCRGRAAEARREADRATVEAEERAQQTTITSAVTERSGPEGARRNEARAELNAAFDLERSDYRGRLEVALDQLDRAVQASRVARRSSELRARRRLLKSDLEAVDRSTEQDWAPLRTRLERDLAAVWQ
jgi:hypothetical protein